MTMTTNEIRVGNAYLIRFEDSIEPAEIVSVQEGGWLVKRIKSGKLEMVGQGKRFICRLDENGVSAAIGGL